MLNYYRDLLKYNKASEEDFLFSQETSFPQESSPSQEVRLLLEETDLSQEEIMLLLEQQANLPLQESSIPQVLNPPQQEEANVLVEEADSQQQQEVIVTTLEANLLQEEATIPQEEKFLSVKKRKKNSPLQEEKNDSLQEKADTTISETVATLQGPPVLEEIPAFRNLLRYKTSPDGKRRFVKELICYTNNDIRPVTFASTSESIINWNEIPGTPTFIVNEIRSPPQPQQPKPQRLKLSSFKRGSSCQPENRNPNPPPGTRKKKESNTNVLSIDDILKGILNVENNN